MEIYFILKAVRESWYLGEKDLSNLCTPHPNDDSFGGFHFRLLNFLKSRLPWHTAMTLATQASLNIFNSIWHSFSKLGYIFSGIILNQKNYMFNGFIYLHIYICYIIFIDVIKCLSREICTIYYFAFYIKKEECKWLDEWKVGEKVFLNLSYLHKVSRAKPRAGTSQIHLGFLFFLIYQ